MTQKTKSPVNLNENVWCQTTSREHNNPFPVIVLEVKGKTALINYMNQHNTEPFKVRISSLYNPF